MKLAPILIIIALVQTAVTKAQTAIGTTTVTNTSTLVDFGTENKGIILPWNSTIPSTPVGGMLIFDSTIGQNRVKVYNGTEWQDLSTETGTVDLTNQNTLTEVGSGTVISDQPNPTQRAQNNSVLELVSETKAMILPKVSNVITTMGSPSAGTMVYDPTLKMICFYNGSKWSFWRQKN